MFKFTSLREFKKLNYVPVGLGEKEFSSHWLRDNTGDNISDKNPIMESIHFTTGFGKTC